MRRSYAEVSPPEGTRGGVQSNRLEPTMHPHPGTPQAMHPRLSVLSTSSLPTGVAGDRSSLSTPPPLAARLSLPASNSTLTLAPRSSIATSVGGGPVPNIYDRNLNKTRTTEVSAAAFAFLFSEMIQYTQKRVSGIGDLERRCVPHTPYTHAHTRISTDPIHALGRSRRLAAVDSTRWVIGSANAYWSS